MPNRLQINFISEALDNLQYLNDYENDFILSISELDDLKLLTEAQNKVLNRIHNKLVNQGRV